MICTDRGRGPGSFPSWGRKKRSVVRASNVTKGVKDSKVVKQKSSNSTNKDQEAEEVHELLRVYLSRADIPSGDSKAAAVMTKPSPKVCVPQTGYYALVTAITILISLLTILGATAAIIFLRKSKSAVRQSMINFIEI